MNRDELEAIVRTQAEEIRKLREQMSHVLTEPEKTQIQTNQAIRYIITLIRQLPPS